MLILYTIFEKNTHIHKSAKLYTFVGPIIIIIFKYIKQIDLTAHMNGKCRHVPIASYKRQKNILNIELMGTF